MKDYEFTMTDEEYAYLQEHFEHERKGIHFDCCEGPFIDVLERACEITDNDKEAMKDFLNHENLDMVLWYLHHYQDQHGIARTFTDLFINRLLFKK